MGIVLILCVFTKILQQMLYFIVFSGTYWEGFCTLILSHSSDAMNQIRPNEKFNFNEQSNSQVA